MKTYKLTGYVLGNYWGGGQGAYPCERLENNDHKKLMQEARSLLKSGGLDSGMGFDGLIGAIVDIEIIDTIEKDGRKYKNSEYETKFIGKLTPKQKTFLEDCRFNY